VTGSTDAQNFPVMNAVQSTPPNCQPLNGIYGGVCAGAFAKINAAGTGLVYSTYFGGSNGETRAPAVAAIYTSWIDAPDRLRRAGRDRCDFRQRTWSGRGFGDGARLAGPDYQFGGRSDLTFDGVAAPLLYVQASQINAIVPFEVAGKTHTNIQVHYGANTSATVRMRIADAVPGVFTTGSLGQEIAALNPDLTLNSPANPAARGTVVAMWATGLGALDQHYADGQIVTGNPAGLAHPPAVMVGRDPTRCKSETRP